MASRTGPSFTCPGERGSLRQAGRKAPASGNWNCRPAWRHAARIKTRSGIRMAAQAIADWLVLGSDDSCCPHLDTEVSGATRGSSRDAHESR